MTTMTDRAFADTNVLLRLMNPAHPMHGAAKSLVAESIEDELELWISRQVSRVYLVQVTRTGFLETALTINQVETQITEIKSLFKVAGDTEAITTKLLQLLKQYPTGKPTHDANIVTTMLVNGIDTLLTTNLRDFKRFKTEITIRALRHAE
jgi:predicted nucleic acid-binding protein